MEITLVPVEGVDAVWKRIENYAQGAADYTYGRFTKGDIRSGLKRKPQQLWVAHEGEKVLGFVVTEMASYPQLKALVMHFTGGIELESWKPMMLEKLQEFSRLHGCDIIESFGRAGWGKVFKKDGFVSRFNFYELPVESIV
jgi:hypothetical protein